MYYMLGGDGIRNVPQFYANINLRGSGNVSIFTIFKLVQVETSLGYWM